MKLVIQSSEPKIELRLTEDTAGCGGGVALIMCRDGEPVDSPYLLRLYEGLDGKIEVERYACPNDRYVRLDDDYVIFKDQDHIIP